MPKIPTRRIPARRKSASSIKRKVLPLRRRSSYLEPSAETLASLNTDFSKLPSYRTAAEFFKALEKDTAD